MYYFCVFLLYTRYTIKSIYMCVYLWLRTKYKYNSQCYRNHWWNEMILAAMQRDNGNGGTMKNVLPIYWCGKVTWCLFSPIPVCKRVSHSIDKRVSWEHLKLAISLRYMCVCVVSFDIWQNEMSKFYFIFIPFIFVLSFCVIFPDYRFLLSMSQCILPTLMGFCFGLRGMTIELDDTQLFCQFTGQGFQLNRSTCSSGRLICRHPTLFGAEIMTNRTLINSSKMRL